MSIEREIVSGYGIEITGNTIDFDKLQEDHNYLEGVNSHESFDIEDELLWYLNGKDYCDMGKVELLAVTSFVEDSRYFLLFTGDIFADTKELYEFQEFIASNKYITQKTLTKVSEISTF